VNVGATMPADSPSFKEVLKSVIADGYDGLLLNDEAGFAGYDRWNNKLRCFFERWLNNQDDSELWEKIAAGAEKHGMAREICFYRIATSAAWALLAGDPANAENFSPEALRSWRNDFLELARCAQTLADHYRKRGFYPGAEEAAQWHEQEAKNFRQSAEETASRIPAERPGRYQSHGRKFTREHIAFMRELAASMRRDSGKPYHEAVAAIANIAYPVIRTPDGRRVVVAAEDVHEVCRRLPPVKRVRFVSRRLRAITPKE
jgi:hypothetical protein